jgi:hypothetical protein
LFNHRFCFQSNPINISKYGQASLIIGSVFKAILLILQNTVKQAINLILSGIGLFVRWKDISMCTSFPKQWDSRVRLVCLHLPEMGDMAKIFGLDGPAPEGPAHGPFK